MKRPRRHLPVKSVLATLAVAPAAMAQQQPPGATDTPNTEPGAAPLVAADEPVRGELDERMVDRMLVELRAEQGGGGIRRTAAEPAAAQAVEKMEVSLDAAKIRQAPEDWFQEAKRSVDLSQAEIIVSVGRGIKEKDNLPVVEKLAKDASPLVRRECAIALRHNSSAKTPALWAQLAQQHDGKDRWYLEALGVGADKQETACFAAWLAAVGDKWNTPAGRDIVWRSRGTNVPAYVVKIISDKNTGEKEKEREQKEKQSRKNEKPDQSQK